MTDNVVPFRPRQRGQAKPPAAEQPSDAFLHQTARRGAPGARKLAAEQAGAERQRYAKAANRQRERELLATGRPVPARISMALDMGGHEGPEVDLAVGTHEGNPAGDVDLWECGLAHPDAEQVKLLAALTGFPIAYFYEPIEPGPLLGGHGRMWICWADKRGCESPEPDLIDDNGVLHYGGERREPPAWWTTGQGALF